ncbi:ABC-three component system protein [Heyndrickxia vini]|uniref:HNH endonuclease n=1 Tax=Heyndrickxia vini TaxID=1476025 RepID=A0ABX7E1M5_9BACI|nr:ABC-three component system protein [Heyndrickxia vini]QQZ09618.1 hypothetical protein I5776_01105 [Heyndrickxia vini]
MARKYPQKDVKLLFMLSAGMCAFPGCTTRCVAKETDFDEPAVLGLIAHIEAHSNDGPRPNLKLTEKERDSYKNWVLLCGVHHDLIDAQSNTYTVEQIRQWKKDLEAKVDLQLREAMIQVTFTELEQVTEAIVGNDFKPTNTNDYKVIPPKEKMEKNNLGDITHQFLLMGMVQFAAVSTYVERINQIIPSFADKLSSGFKNEYLKLKNENLNGDDLFLALINFACPKRVDLKRHAAGIAVLTYLFHICEVFEK